MKLLSCYIENFGKLCKFKYDFSSGINVINHENGWGKTTFVTFIKAMFYGLPATTKRDLDENERKKYRPWQGGNFGGYIIFEHEGKEYKLQRFFGVKEAEDSFTLYDVKTGKESKDFSKNIGEEIFKLDQGSYERCVFIPQKEPVRGINDSIKNKLINVMLGSSSGDKQSLESAVALIEKRKAEIKNKQKRGELADAENLLIEAEDKIRDINLLLTNTKVIEDNILSKSQEIQKLEEQKESINKDIAAYSKHSEAVANKKRVEDANEQLENIEAELKNVCDILNGQELNKNELSETSSTLLKYEQCGTKQSALLEQKQATIKSQATLKEYFSEPISDAEVLEKLKLNAELVALTKNTQVPQDVSTNKSKKASGRLASIALICVMAALLVVGALLVKVNISVSIISFAAAFTNLLASAFIYFRWYVEQKTQALKNVNNFEYVSQKNAHNITQIETELTTFIKKTAESERDFTKALNNIYQNVIAIKKLEEDIFRLEDLLEKESKQANTLKVKLDDFFVKFNIDSKLCYSDKLNILKQATEYLPKLTQEKQAVLVKLKQLKENLIIDGTAHDYDINDMQAKLREYQVRLDEIKEQRNNNINRLNQINEQASELKDYENQRDFYQEKVKALENENKLLELTKKYLNDASDALTSKYLQPMKNSLIKYLNLLTNVQYDNLNLDTEFNISFEEFGNLRETGYLSKGYLSVVDLCIRFALIDALLEREKPFIVLDDPFIYMDEQKIKSSTVLLNNISKKYQIIYLVCHKSREIAVK